MENDKKIVVKVKKQVQKTKPNKETEKKKLRVVIRGKRVLLSNT